MRRSPPSTRTSPAKWPPARSATRSARRRSRRITYAETMQGLGDADLVIEAATEDETVKRKIFVALCPFIKPDAIVATNTSSISITRLAAGDRPA